LHNTPDKSCKIKFLRFAALHNLQMTKYEKIRHPV